MLYKKILSGFVSLSFFVNPYYSYGGVGTKDPEQDPLEYSDYIITSNIQSSMLASTSSTELSLSSAQQQLIAAADNGDALMQFEVALNFAIGRRGFPYDIDKGINYLRLASSGKYIPAMFEYASLLENGSTGVEKNYSEAAKTYLTIVSMLLEKEKLQDFAYFIALSCYRLGLIYENDNYQELELKLTLDNTSKEAKSYYKKGLKFLKKTNVPNKEVLKSDLCYLLGKDKKLSNRYFANKACKHHPLIQYNLIINDQHAYNGLSNNPQSSRESIDKLQKRILKSQEKLAHNNYIALLKAVKEDTRSEFLQQFIRCYSRMNHTSNSFAAQKNLILGKATAILNTQRDLMKTYDPSQEEQRKKLLKLHENYVINQLVYNRIVQSFTHSYEGNNGAEAATNSEAINEYLQALASGDLKSANLKLLRYYGRIDDFENSSKIVERVIQFSAEPAQTNPAQTNNAKSSMATDSMANNIDLTHIEGDDLRDLLDAVSADNTVTGLILQQKNLSEINDLLNQVLTGNPNLERLDLSENQITASQFQTIAKNLKRLPHLRELVLDNNLLRDEGVSFLLPVIRKNLHLQLLSLTNNEISQLGGAMLFGALAQVRMREDPSFKLILNGNEGQKFLNLETSKNILSNFPEKIDNSIKIISRKPLDDDYKNKNPVWVSILASARENGMQKVSVQRKAHLVEDKRVKIVKTDSWPNSVHGIVFMRFPDTKPDTYEWGSGTLIAPDMVLTAAHNLYNARTNQEITEVRFIAAIKDGALPFYESKVIKYYFPEDYKTSQKDDFSSNYGLLVLDSKLGYSTGYFGLESIAEDALKTKSINITGYPADKVDGKDRCYEMWSVSGPIKDIKDDIIHYEIDTYSGMNGGGVWYQKGEDFRIVGVHVGGDIELGVNYAVYLTPMRYNQIINWIKDYVLEKMSKSFLRAGESFATLKTLDLSDYKIGDIIAQFFTSNRFSSLTELNLTRNLISTVEAVALAQNSTLTQLDLRCNNIDSAGAKAFAQNTTLTELNLHYNKVSAVGAHALSLNTTLTRLMLSSNNIGDAGVQALSWNTTLTQLDLSGQNDRIGDASAQALAHNTTLLHLNLEGNIICAAGAKALAKNTTLLQLNLRNNNIDAVGAQALAQNTTLTKLDLSGNNIAEEGLIAIARNNTITNLNLGIGRSQLGPHGIQVWQALAQNTTLKQLGLYSQIMGDSGAAAFAQNNTLTQLDLDRNNIGAAGAQALAKNTTLTQLNLRWNKIGDLGAQALANNTTLTQLDLSWDENKVGDLGAIALAQNTTLTQLSLSLENIGNAGRKALRDSVNPKLRSLG